MNQNNAMDTSAENIVECILTDKEDVVVRISRTSSALRKEGERRYSIGQQQRPDDVNNSDMDTFYNTNSFLEKKRSISFHEQVKVKITPRYEREDIPSLFYSCSDIKEFRISAYLCIGAPMDEEDEVVVENPAIEANPDENQWCLDCCQPSSSSTSNFCWQMGASQ
mmetsp:Transcript_19617/g.28004  ORF Transcript_19617/g.28004 Transcript_19617/m.28004 type:complete len:166 (-) Transcript_19617:120-617(-)